MLNALHTPYCRRRLLDQPEHQHYQHRERSLGLGRLHSNSFSFLHVGGFSPHGITPPAPSFPGTVVTSMLLSSHTCNPLCSSTCISLRSSLVHAVPITKILGREPCSPSTMPGWLTHGGLARLGWDARAPHTMSFRALLASSGQGHYSLSLSCDDFLGFTLSLFLAIALF